MSNSATITNEIKQTFATIANSLVKVHEQLQLAINCHDRKHTEAVLHNVQDASDSFDVVYNLNATIPGLFAKLRQVVISYTTNNDPCGALKWWKEDQHKREMIYPAEFRMSDTLNMPDDYPNNEAIMFIYEQIHKKFNGDMTKINSWYKEAKNEYYESERQRKRKMMETAMAKQLPPTTPTRRIKPTVCPPAPKRKGKYAPGANRYAELASSDSDSSTLLIPSPPSPPQDRRRGGRPCTPGCCAPPTPQISAVSPPPIDWGEYDPVPDAIDLNDYDMWGRKIHYDLF